MPQSTRERQARWESDGKAISFLEAAGYELRKDWTWKPPKATTWWHECPYDAGSPWEKPSPMEEDAMLYLIEEWDYGGWRIDKESETI